ncbi:hypothetical protein HAX54_027952, partial [Datura stramonium]|nr:hypothetical protein [Datura stramonium]
EGGLTPFDGQGFSTIDMTNRQLQRRSMDESVEFFGKGGQIYEIFPRLTGRFVLPDNGAVANLRGGSFYLVLASYLCCVLYGWMDHPGLYLFILFLSQNQWC